MAPLVRTGGSRHTGLAALPHRNIQINYKKEVKKDSKKIRISFENKGQKMYKELIQSLKELSFVKVAELKDELTIGQDVIIYDYFY